MNWRGVVGTEWFAAVALVTASVTSTLLLRHQVLEVAADTARRQTQLDKLAVLRSTSEMPSARQLAELDGLFRGHTLRLERGPGGPFLVPHPTIDAEGSR